MSFDLGKPPIIEAWIRATMIAAPDSEWDWSCVERMLKTSGEEFTELEQLPEFTPKAKGVTKNQLLPKEIEIHVAPRYLRTRTASRSKTVQIGRNELIVSHSRTDDESYPGFHRLLEAFLLALEGYREHIPTVGVALAELHYVDLVVIPEMYNSTKTPKDYFVGAPELPDEPFGDVAGVSWSVLLSHNETHDLGQLAVQTQPPDGMDGRFRLDWHCWCSELSADDLSAIASRLKSAHNYLNSCFQAVCMPSVWNLFEPK